MYIRNNIMPKKLTTRKIDSLIKENRKLLSQRSDNKEFNNLILEKYVMLLISELDILNNDNSDQSKSFSKKDKATYICDTGHIKKEIKQQVQDKGAFVLQKGNAQRMDDFQGTSP